MDHHLTTPKKLHLLFRFYERNTGLAEKLTIELTIQM